MRLIRWAGENISPSDDGRLYEKIFEDGLYSMPTIAPAGAAKINIGAMYGIICGREFTSDAMQINAVLPTSGTKTGKIYVECDTAQDEPLSVKTTLSASWTPTRQDINVSGTLAQVQIGVYEATATGVTYASSKNEKYATFGRSIGKSLSDLGEETTTLRNGFNTFRNDTVQVGESLTRTVFGTNWDGSSYGAPLVVWKNYSTPFTVPGNIGVALTANDFGVSTVTDYTPIAASVFSTSSPQVIPRSVSVVATGTQNMMIVRNTSSTEVTGTANIRIVYIRNSVIHSY